MQISEKEYEDWAEQNIAAVCGAGACLLDRQVRLPSSGRVMDLIAHTKHLDGGSTLHVVELKATTAGSAALVQLLDYVGQVQALAHLFLAETPEGNGPIHVRGVLAAPSFDYAITSPAHAAGVELIRLRATVLIEAEGDHGWKGIAGDADAGEFMGRYYGDGYPTLRSTP